MPLFSKEGDPTLYEIDDTEEEIALAKSKGYQPYVEVTKDGQEWAAIPADVKELQVARDKGWLTENEFNTQQRVKQESKVQFTPTEAYITGAGEESTLGLGKYASAISKSLLSGTPFNKELEAIEYQQQRMQEQQSLPYLAGQLTGAIGTGLVTGAAAPGATVARTIGKAAAVEGATGLIQGIATSEAASKLAKGEEVQDAGSQLLKDGISGGLMSALAGGAGGALAELPKVASQTARATRATGKLLQSGQESLIESGRRTEGAGWITKQFAKVGDLYDNILTNYSNVRDTAKLARSLRAKYGEEAVDLSNADLINLAAASGDDEVITFMAERIAKKVNEPDLDLIKKSLLMDPDTVAIARIFDKKEMAQTIADELGPAATNFEKAMGQLYRDKLNVARASFKPQPPVIQDSIQEAISELQGAKSAETQEAVAKLQDIYGRLSGIDLKEFGEFTPTTKMILEGRGVAQWERMSPQRQFDLLKDSREALDAALARVYDPKTKKPKGSLSTAEKALYGVRKEIDGLLKGADEMAENDATYKAFVPVRNLLRDLSERHPDTNELIINPAKVATFLKDTNSAGALKLQLGIAEDLITKLPADQVDEIAPLVGALKQIRDFQNTSELAKRVESFQTAATKFKKSEVKGIEAALGEGVTKMGITDPASLEKSLFQLNNLATKHLGLANFKAANPTQKRALLEAEAKIRKKKLYGQEAAVWASIAKKYKLPLTGE